MGDIDWSTPYDEWLVPLLNKVRYAGPIEFRALPSLVQLEFDKVLAQKEKEYRQSEKDQLFSILRHCGYIIDHKQVNDMSKKWKESMRQAEIQGQMRKEIM